MDSIVVEESTCGWLKVKILIDNWVHNGGEFKLTVETARRFNEFWEAFYSYISHALFFTSSLFWWTQCMIVVLDIDLPMFLASQKNSSVRWMNISSKINITKYHDLFNENKKKIN